MTLDATGLYGGDYDARIVVSSNDPLEGQVSVPAHLRVTGAPDIAISASALDFGPLFIGLSATRTITVSNVGTDVLDVSGITVDHPAFTAAPATLSLTPGESATVTVTFAPATAEALTGTLTFASNDPDEGALPVSLRGEGLIPPDIGVAPNSFSESLLTGERVTRTLTIQNTGGNDLVFDARVADSSGPGMPPPSTAAGALSGVYTGSYLAFGISDWGEVMPFQYPVGNEHLAIGTHASGYTVAYRAAGADQVCWAAYDSRSCIAAVSYREVLNTPERVVVEVVTRTSDGVLQITRRFTFLPNDKFVAIKTTLANLSGGNLTDVVFKAYADWDVDGDYDDDSWDYDRGRNMVVAWDTSYVGIASAERPASMDIYGWNDYQVRETIVDVPSGPVSNFDGFALVHFDLGSLAPSGSGSVTTAYGAGSDLADLGHTIDRGMAAAAGWLTVIPTTGRVPPGGSMDLAVNYDAASLYGGDYGAAISIESNDPDEPEVRVPALLHVTGAPDIAVSGESVALESTIAYTADGARTVHDLAITVPPAASGTVTLIAEGDYGDPSESASASAEGIALGSVGGTGSDCTAATGTFTVSAADLAALTSDGVVEIAVQNTTAVGAWCGLDRHTVRLSYESSASLIDYGAVYLGQSRARAIEVSNVGTDILDVSAIAVDDPAFTATPASLTLAPGAKAAVTVTYSPVSPGVSAGTLTLRSNDPDEGTVSVSLHGEGSIPPDIGVVPGSFDESLLTGGRVTRTLTIENSGGADLVFDASVTGSPAAVEPPPSAGGGALSGSYTGTYLAFGISDWGEIMPFQYPVGNEHLALGTYASGYTVAYGAGGLDHVCYAAYDSRDCIVAVSYRETLRTPQRVEVEVVTRTSDGFLQITRHFTFLTNDKFVAIKTTLANRSGSNLTDVVFKAHADWDVDGDYSDDDWDYDFARNMVVAWDERYIGIASSERPAFLDIDGWEDYAVRDTLVNYPSGPVFDFDGFAISHFDLGSLAPSGSRSVTTAYGAGDNLAELQRVVDRGLAASANWLTITPERGTVPPGGSVGLAVTFDAAGLNGGDYDAAVLLASNDPDELEVRVPARLHVTGAPDIELSDTAFDFGRLFVGQSATRTLTVSNVGTDLLSVSGIAADDPAFAATPASLSLAPGASASVTVTFSPAASGVFTSTLTVTSNDPDEPHATIALGGEALVPPEIAVAPTGFYESLASGDQVTRALTIQNSGGSDLTFDVIAARAAGLASDGPGGVAWPAGEPVPLSFDPATSSRMTGARAQQPPVGHAVTSGADILVLATNYVDSSVLRALSELGRRYDYVYTDNFASVNFAPYENIIVAMDGGYVEESDVQALANAAAGGKNLFMLGGTNYTPYSNGVARYLLPHTGDTTWQTSTTPHLRVVNASDPLALGLPATHTFYQSGASYYMLRINDPAASIAVMNGDGRPALVYKTIGLGTLVYFINTPYGGNWGYAPDFAILKQVIANALNLAPAWVRIAPSSGSVPAGESAALAVTFDATGLAPGLYDAGIVVRSNDPDEPEVSLPTRLHVIGIPNIRLSTRDLDFGQLYLGTSRTQMFSVSNIGTDSLRVSAITVDDPSFIATPQSLSLPPGQSAQVSVTFTPSVAGVVAQTLTVVSDDPDEGTIPVALRGTALTPAQIVVTPPSLAASVLEGRSESRTLTIANPGGIDLHWSLATHSPATSLEVTLSALDENHTAVTDIIPSRFDFGGGESGYSIVNDGSQMYDEGNLLSTNLGAYLEYSNGAIRDSALLGTGGRYFTRKYPGLFVLAADLAGVQRFEISGDLGANYLGLATGAVLETSIDGVVYSGYLKRVFSAGVPSVNHLIVVQKAAGIAHAFSGVTDQDYHAVSGLSGTRRFFYLLFAGANGAFIDDWQALRIMRAFLGAAVRPPLAAEPMSGTVPPSGRTDLAVTIGSRWVLRGTYDLAFDISSDDPVQPRVTVPVTLTVFPDSDRDGVGDSQDNCPGRANPAQEDGDGDGFGDVCDNCPAAANPDQADSNADGSGDACQPSLVLEAIRQDGGTDLEVRARASDPQGDPIGGAFKFTEVGEDVIVLQDMLVTGDCSLGWFPDPPSRKAIAYGNEPWGGPYLFDPDPFLGCDDWNPDYWFAAGSCESPSGDFEVWVSLEGLRLPAPICVRRFEGDPSPFTITVLDVSAGALRIRPTPPGARDVVIPFAGRLPRETDISGLTADVRYALEITATDGNTLPVKAEMEFLHRNESRMIVNYPPHAAITAPADTECDLPDGASVVLDGSASEDPDSDPGTNNDIVAFEWFDDTTPPGGAPLGTGAVLHAVLPVGSHRVRLRATDSLGESDESVVTLGVHDTVSPSVSCPPGAQAECGSAGGAWVSVGVAAHDACSSALSIVNDRTAGGADASGSYPLGTTVVTFTATDAAGNTASCQTSVTVRDTVPPVLTVVASPNALWPPNHGLFAVGSAAIVSDLCDPAPAIVLVSATSSEPDDAPGAGDGHTTDDVQDASIGTPDFQVLLRAERDGTGSGRVYTLTYRAADASGNAASASARITVPHDMRDVAVEPLNLVVENARDTRIMWGPVEGAQHYDVIRGDVANLRIAGSDIDLGQAVCIVHATAGTTTLGDEDTEVPATGHVFFYVAQYFNGVANSSYGSESAGRARVIQPGHGDCQ